MPNKINRVGQRYGRLVVVAPAAPINKTTMWTVRCDCGSPDKAIRDGNLKQGRTKSCGCLFSEGVRTFSRTHGRRKTRAYSSWANMFQRCYNPKSFGWPWYGARGIAVSEEFKTFAGFYAHLGDCPAGLTLDRIDNDKNYEPGNVRWADRLTQSLNRRCVRKQIA